MLRPTNSTASCLNAAVVTIVQLFVAVSDATVAVLFFFLPFMQRDVH